MRKLMIFWWALLSLTSIPTAAAVSDFEDLGLPPESYHNGSDGSGGFSSGGVHFNNNYNEMYGSWDGFSASTVTDTVTPGFENQYSAVTGMGVAGSATYGIGYVGWEEPPTVTFAEPVSASGVFVTNTTYVYLSMRDGDAFAKKFGGETGDDPDWFMLTITGMDETGHSTGSVNFYLADFRFDDPARDYILDGWAWVDLGVLGEVKKLIFTLSSSDVGDFGMNTPAFFAVDNLNPPVGASKFEDLGLAPESFYNGSDGAGGFMSGRASFKNSYSADWDSWDGFSASTVTDNETPGFMNQYSAFPGVGAGGSNTYAVAFVGWTDPPTVTFAESKTVYGVYLTNTTYTGLSMRDGDGFAKKFGGDTGDDPDWFMLTITGMDETGHPISSVDFYLADFRFDDNSRDYILDEWTWADLSRLGEVMGITFTLSSSDVGDFGMNTPAYFALDNLIVSPQAPIPDIKAGGSGDSIHVRPMEPVAITVSLDAGDYSGEKAEWWVFREYNGYWPMTTYFKFTGSARLVGVGEPQPVVVLPIFDLPEVEVLQDIGFLPGRYVYRFAVDTKLDGVFDGTWSDWVEVCLGCGSAR